MGREIPIISRRRFIKGSAAILTLGAFTQGLHLRSEYTDKEYKKGKDVQPHLKSNTENPSILLGVYPHKNDPDNVRHLDDFGIVGYFGPWFDWTAKGAIHTYNEGQIPMVSTGPFHPRAPNKPFTYRDLVSDIDHIKKQALKLKNLPRCLFRYGFEMNADWFPHGSAAQSPRDFIDGWNLVTGIVKKVNPNIQTVWAPNVDFPIEPYFPRDFDMKPDFMALDGYCKHHLSLLHARHLQPDPSGPQLYNKDILTLQELDNEIPIIISEIGVDYGNSPNARATSLMWMTDTLHKLATYRQVVAACIFGWNKDKGPLNIHEGNWQNILSDQFHEVIQQGPFARQSTLYI